MAIYTKEALMQDPGNLFKTPRNLVEIADLSTQQKVVVLEQWKDEVLQRMVAEEENMGGNPGNAELLQQINNALEELNQGL